ncbi:MAG TPA: DUF2231 domain-containing protein [Kofleriaceae bacterium]|jgi:uncharacterized membrane protein
MLTKARIAGHPIHPMLIAFPVALYTSTAVALIVFGGTHDPFWFRAAFWANLAGIVMGAVAAIPGAIDLFTLPGHTMARRTGYIHAAFNVTALVLFVISDVLIGHRLYAGALASYGAPLALSLCGVAATVGAGALGWTLVQTHHVGVNPTEQPVVDRPVDKVADLDAIFPPVPRSRESVQWRH